MNKLLHLFILFSSIILSCDLSGQTIYFNKAIDLGGIFGSGHSILPIDSGYYMSSVVGGGRINVGLVFINIDGDFQWIKKYGKTGYNYYDGRPGSFKMFYDDQFILGGSISDGDTAKAVLYRFDNHLDTIISKSFISNIDRYYIGNSCSHSFADEFVLTGEEYIEGYNTDVFLVKADSLGCEQWRSTFGWNTADAGFSVIQTPDSGYVVGGYTYMPGAQNSGDPLVVKFDKDGEYLWHDKPGGQYKEAQAMVCATYDSCIAVLTTYTDSMLTSDFGYSRIRAIKYDQDGEIIWDHFYGKSKLANFISNIKLTPDGGFICVGYNYIEDTAYNAGWLLKLNANGDSIWFRNYMYYTTYLANENQLYDVSPAPDGGYIATGQVYAMPPNSLQKIWILKVDSLGCDTPGCNIPVGIRAYEPEEVEAILLYPNPASSVLSVECLALNEGQEQGGELEVWDLFGRKIEQVHIPEDQQNLQINVSSYPPGVYIAIIKNQNRIVAREKFVVTK